MKNNIIYHWAFRILTPIIFAFFIYVLILLFFDSALQLLDNIISIEYFVCLVLTYLNFELWRVIIKLCSKHCNKSPWHQITMQISFSLVSAILFTGLLVWLYFTFIVGLISFTSELIIFCALFAVSALLYNMIFTSQFFLNYQHKEIIREQEKLKKEAVNRWQRFQNKINPNLLYQSLEQIIGYAHSDIDKADELLIHLTHLYRQILDNQDELIHINKELELLEKLDNLLKIVQNNHVEIKIDQINSADRYMIPGFLILHIQQIVNQNITNNLQPLRIKLTVDSNEIRISYTQNLRLATTNTEQIDLSFEIETLNWYSQKQIQYDKDESLITVTIPLINLDKS